MPATFIKCSLSNRLMFNEEDLVHKISADDTKAFEILVKQYEKLVFHVVTRLVGDEQDKEDICQEVFIKVHKNLGKFKFQSRLSTWIATIAYHTAINYLKRHRKHDSHPCTGTDLDNYYFTNDDPQQILSKKDVNKYVNDLIEKMPEQYRILLTLYHLNEFSYQEIENITGMPVGTVKNYLFRARKLLKEKLQDYLQNDIT